MWSRYVWSQKCTQFKAAAATFGQRLLLLDTLHMCHGQFQANVTGFIFCTMVFFKSLGFNSFTCRNGAADKFRKQSDIKYLIHLTCGIYKRLLKNML